MLEELSIKDFALIDKAHLEFSKGFTVLSGETGAGKSLLIGAISFLLGGRAGLEQIRTGASEASVSGTFLLDLQNEKFSSSDAEGSEAKSAAEWLYLHGIEAEDGRVLLRRIVRSNGKSSAWIGSTPVTRADLASFGSFLIDIHGQHEHQSLMKVPEHRKFLDSYAGLNEKVSAFTGLYSKLVEKRRSLAELESDDSRREEKIELLSFAVKEISEAKLKAGEDKALEDEENKLLSFEKLYNEIESVTGILDGGDDGEGVIGAMKKIRMSASNASSLDKSLEKLTERFESSFYELSDIASEYSRYKQSLVFDPERLNEVQERNALIYNLKKKYAPSVSSPIEDVIKYAQDAQEKLDSLQGSAQGKEELQKEISALEKEVYAEAKAISAERKKASLLMAKSVEDVLSKLGMKGTKFSVNIEEKSGDGVEQKCGPYGIDNIEFLIAANAGNPLQPLAKIASGGELSRVMLALKTIFARTDPVDTMIFDEIDTGIGGEVAVSVGSHLKNLAKNRQVLCITHLASIAVYADNQIKIEKSVKNGATETAVHGISGDARVSEIARMLSGDPLSAESLEHARSMLAKFSA